MNIGETAIIVAAVCLFNTWRLHRNFIGQRAQYSVLILSCLTYLVQLMGGVVLVVSPHSEWVINGLCYIVFASFTITLVRAWDLVQGRVSTTARTRQFATHSIQPAQRYGATSRGPTNSETVAKSPQRSGPRRGETGRIDEQSLSARDLDRH